MGTCQIDYVVIFVSGVGEGGSNKLRKQNQCHAVCWFTRFFYKVTDVPNNRKPVYMLILHFLSSEGDFLCTIDSLLLGEQTQIGRTDITIGSEQ